MKRVCRGVRRPAFARPRSALSKLQTKWKGCAKVLWSNAKAGRFEPNREISGSADRVVNWDLRVEESREPSSQLFSRTRIPPPNQPSACRPRARAEDPGRAGGTA